MDRLDLNALGVVEMDKVEIEKVEGGAISIFRIEGLFTEGPCHAWLFGAQLW
jgi:hypothetical protein